MRLRLLPTANATLSLAGFGNLAASSTDSEGHAPGAPSGGSLAVTVHALGFNVVAAGLTAERAGSYGKRILAHFGRCVFVKPLQ